MIIYKKFILDINSKILEIKKSKTFRYHKTYALLKLFFNRKNNNNIPIKCWFNLINNVFIREQLIPLNIKDQKKCI